MHEILSLDFHQALDLVIDHIGLQVTSPNSPLDKKLWQLSDGTIVGMAGVIIARPGDPIPQDCLERSHDSF